MENYFRSALNNFIFEEAGCGAIRHLADRGYTAKQITETLSFPIPYEKVRETFTEYLLACSVLLKESPHSYREPEKTEFVREYDKYGKATFRKVTISPEKDSKGIFGTGSWREMDFPEFLRLYRERPEKISLPGETDFAETKKNIYLACTFGREKMESMSGALEKAQQEYLSGICWTKRTMYHLMNGRMLHIAERLQKSGLPVGGVYLHLSE